jgi:hypothetical protein
VVNAVAAVSFDDLEENHDFDEDEKTPVVPYETMAEVMEFVRSPGIPTLTSDMPTQPHRPSVINNMERQ